MDPKSLLRAIRAVTKHPAKHVHLHRANGTLTVFVVGAIYVAATVEDDGNPFCVSLDRTKALRAALSGSAPVILDASPTSLTVTGAGWVVSVPCAASDETPKTPPAMFPLPAALLTAARSMPASDTSRYMLDCLHVEPNRAACTNGNTLCYVGTPEALIPADIPAWMVGPGLSYVVVDNFVWAQSGNVIMRDRKREANFPDYRTVLPASFAWTLTVNRVAMISALTAARAVVAAGRYEMVRLNHIDGGLVITGQIVDVGRVTARVESAALVGTMAPIFLNAAYLLNVMQSFPASESVTLSGNEPLQPVRATADGSAVTWIVMPVRGD